MKILVTGGAGFIGSHVVERLLERGDSVVCIDDFNGYLYDSKLKENNIKNCLNNPNFKVYKKDIKDLVSVSSIIKNEEIEKIIHLAAHAGVRKSIEDVYSYIHNNILGTLNLLEAAKTSNIKNFVFASSSSIYGNTGGPSCKEEDVLGSPISHYAITKLTGEKLCYNFHHLFGLNVICLRLFTTYGPRGRPNMAPYIFTKAALKGERVEIYGNFYSKRDYTYIDDTVDGIIKALDSEFGFEIINLGRGKPISLMDLIKIIEEKTGKELFIKKVPGQPGDVDVTNADTFKAKKLLNYKPDVDLEEGIEKFVEWFKKTDGGYKV